MKLNDDEPVLIWLEEVCQGNVARRARVMTAKRLPNGTKYLSLRLIDGQPAGATRDKITFYERDGHLEPF